MYKLHIRDDAGKTKVVTVKRDKITVGRQEGNTIRLTDKNVSRIHARIVNKDGQIFLEDVSRYGTRVNGLRLREKKPLTAEDVVGMVRTQLSTDDAPDLHHIHGYIEGMERAVATPYVPDEDPVEQPTYMTETGASLPNPDAEEHYLIDMVCDPASLPGPIRRALMLQGKT